MFTRLWHFLINSFTLATRSNYKKALELGIDHQARLAFNQTDPAVAAMLLTFDPVLQAFVTADQNLDSALGDYKGDTQSLEQLFDLMNIEKLPYWEGQVFVHFPKGTPSATQLFPNGRKPFQASTYSKRIQAIKVFGDKCALITELVPLSVNVLSFHLQLQSARALQMTDGKARVAALRDLRETARVSLCTEMYGNLGLLMHRHRKDTVQVEKFFNLTLLRRKTESGPQVVIARGTATNAQTGDPVVNAEVKFILSAAQTVIVFTDSNGKFEAELGTFEDTINVTMEVNAIGFDPFTNSGPIEPGEDVDIDVQLVPRVVPPIP